MARFHETFVTFCDPRAPQTSSHDPSWNERVAAASSGMSCQALDALAACVSAVRLTDVVVSTPPDKYRMLTAPPPLMLLRLAQSSPPPSRSTWISPPVVTRRK